MPVGGFVGHPLLFTLGSSLREEVRDLVGGDGALADDAPALVFVAQVNDGGGDVAWRGASIHDDVDASLELVTDLLRARAFGGATEVGRSGGDRDRGRRHYGKRNLCVGHAQGNVARVGS